MKLRGPILNDKAPTECDPCLLASFFTKIHL